MLEMDPRDHHVVRTHVSAWLDREFPRHGLFTFYNSDARVWEIGQWAGGGRCHERCIIGPCLGMFDRRMASELRHDIHRGVEDFRKWRAEFRHSQHRRDTETNEYEKDFQKFMRWYNKKHRVTSQMLLAMDGTFGPN